MAVWWELIHPAGMLLASARCCSDLFGLKHFAANYTTLQFAPAMGSYLLATEVTGWLYDRAAEAHGDIHQVGCKCCSASAHVTCKYAMARSITMHA